MASPVSVFADGTAKLYRFPSAGARGEPAATPVLLVPSLINRWYILDLRPGASLVDALAGAGHELFGVDWGAAQDEDRYLTWEDVLARLGRCVRRVRRETGAEKVTLVGYCMGATLAGIHAALEPDGIAGFVNLAGPFDFAHAGPLGKMTDARWFDAGAIADAGNVSATQMQSGFSALRPTLQLSKWITYADRAADAGFRDAFWAMERWASDNIPFPAAAYRTYIEELYQKNALVRGEHRVGGRPVDLGRIDCPVLTVVADKDNICPPRAATALNERCGSKQAEVLTLPGGHVGAIAGPKSAATLYPALDQWLRRNTWS